MAVRLISIVIAAAFAGAIAAPAQADALKQVGTIVFPDTPINQFGIIGVNQATGLGYLADKDNKAVVVFDTNTDKFVSRIGGFVGITKSGKASGPNGVAVVNGGTEIWVSDGDSTIKMIDAKTNAITATIATGGKVRANGIAFNPKDRIVIVANSDDDPPFLSFISSEPGHKIVAKVPVPESGENLERSAYHGPSDSFFTVIPVLRSEPTKGLLAQTNAKTGKLVKLYELERCHPHSLAVVSDAALFMGCSSAHEPARKPGGDLAIFDIPSARIVSYAEGLGGNGGSDTDLGLGRYYHSTTNGQLVVMDIKSQKPLQTVKTPRGSRSLGVNHANHRVYLATNAKDGPCGGCVMVFAPD